MLLAQISTAFSDRPGEALIEAMRAGVRFWTANGDFRTVLYGEGGRDIASLSKPLSDIAYSYADHLGREGEEREALVFRALSTFYGTLLLVFSSSLSLDEALSHLSIENL